MYKFNQSINTLQSTKELHSGLFLWIWNPSKKSPHLGISVDGKYFSLQHNRKQEKVDIDILCKHIRQKKNAVLLVGLNSEITLKRIKEVFIGYESCEIDDCACSKPLFELFNIHKESGILFDLLEHEKDAFHVLYGIGLEHNFEGIPEYTYDDVLFNLNTLTV